MLLVIQTKTIMDRQRHKRLKKNTAVMETETRIKLMQTQEVFAQNSLLLSGSNRKPIFFLYIYLWPLELLEDKKINQKFRVDNGIQPINILLLPYIPHLSTLSKE